VLRGRSVADPPDDPVVVEALGELPEGPVEFLDGVEGPEPEELFLEGSDEPPQPELGASVPFGLPDEGRAGGDADGLELVLEGVGDELASVVMPEAGPEVDELLEQLLPVLWSTAFRGDRELKAWAAGLVDGCRRGLARLLPFTAAEREFLDGVLDRGEVKAALLTDDEELAQRIALQPSLAWKVQNVRKHFGR